MILSISRQAIKRPDRSMRMSIHGLLLGLMVVGAPFVAAKPNVILIMADDLGWGDVGFQGNALIQTPHLDAMAKNGLTFSRFYAAAPVCSPTRGSCLTGRHPARLGIPYANSGHLRPEEDTLAEILKKQGYATGFFGKWHLGTLTKTVKDANRGGPRGVAHYSPPQEHGFDVSFATESKVPTHGPLRVPKTFGEGASRKIGWDALSPEDASEHYGTHYWNEAGDLVDEPLLGDDSEVIMTRAMRFIEESVMGSEPFFATIWFHAPHLPVVASAKHRKPYQSHGLHERNYYGCITAMDEQIGRLRAHLRALGVADDTMVWFCSDNGPEGNTEAPGSAGPWRGRKRSLYEGGVRVPALLEWPAKIPHARTTDCAAVTSDYLPTVLDVLDLPTPERILDGETLLPVIEEKREARSGPIGFQSRKVLAWHEGVMKLVVTEQADLPRVELYDLSQDPKESVNLADSHPETVARLRRAADAWWHSCQRDARQQP